MMENIIAMLFILLLLGLAWLDFRYREVHTVLFPVLLALALLRAFVGQLLSWPDLLVNLSLLSLQGLLASLYFLLRGKARLLATERLIGWGDVLFFLVLACCFSPFNFLLFFVLSLLFSLSMALLYRFFIGPMPHIPLAGMQAMLLALLLLYELGRGRPVSFDDAFLMDLIDKL